MIRGGKIAFSLFPPYHFFARSNFPRARVFRLLKLSLFVIYTVYEASRNEVAWGTGKRTVCCRMKQKACSDALKKLSSRSVAQCNNRSNLAGNNTNFGKEACTTNSALWPVLYACGQPYHPGSAWLHRLSSPEPVVGWHLGKEWAAHGWFCPGDIALRMCKLQL